MYVELYTAIIVPVEHHAFAGKGDTSTTLCNGSYVSLTCFIYYKQETYVFFQFQIITNALVIAFRFIWIPMLCVYGYYKIVYSISAGIDFRRQNVTFIDLTSTVGPRTERVKHNEWFVSAEVWLFVRLVHITDWTPTLLEVAGVNPGQIFLV